MSATIFFLHCFSFKVSLTCLTTRMHSKENQYNIHLSCSHLTILSHFLRYTLQCVTYISHWQNFFIKNSRTKKTLKKSNLSVSQVNAVCVLLKGIASCLWLVIYVNKSKVTLNKFIYRPISIHTLGQTQIVR